MFGLGEHSPKPPKWIHKSTPAKGAPGIPTLFISDFHWGEVVTKSNVNNLNEYDRKIGRKRVEFTINSAIDLCTNHMVNPKYPGIVLALGGDMMSGNIHDELTESNDGTTIDHVLELFDQMIWTISTLADKFGKVFVPTCYGNHSRAYQQYRNKEAAHLSFDWLLYNMLEKHFKNNKEDPSFFAKFKRINAFFYALVCTVSSVIGGIIGYCIGFFFFNSLGILIINYYGLQNQFNNFEQYYQLFGIWLVLGAGFTPFPFKFITIASGFFGFNIFIFNG